MAQCSCQQRLSTGVEGVDDILGGGLIENRSYLVRGGPGTGKTTLGLHFLTAADQGEPVLFIGFQEPEAQVEANARAVGLDVTSINFLSLIPDEHFFTEQQGYDIFASADVEQEPLVEAIVQAVTEHAPKRVFVDSLTQLRFLSADAYQYRKQVMSFLRFLTKRGATVLFSSESSQDTPDDDLQFMADGVLNLDTGQAGPVVRVTKFRGSGFVHGRHHMRLSNTGLQVFPRLIPPLAKHCKEESTLWSSGSSRIDAILHGGFEAGTISMVTGPAGVGKSTLAAQFAAAAARRGGTSALFLFEEDVSIFLRRTQSLGLGLNQAVREGTVVIEPVEPMRYLADEFTSEALQQVTQRGVELVILDSVAGFGLTLGGEEVEERLHTFAKTLARLGVTVILINETQAVTGQEFQATEKGFSYLSDNLVFLRYIETAGEMKKALGVLKKRLSGFDTALHTYDIGEGGLIVHEPIEGLHSVLSGMPSQDLG
ncbi:circadian clock protein KaiC [Modicisalibacter xianhensis]|uniref:non-specific serine/threonine protein kinase n=1 Tax=Modicisalibacter xianhensis TaxID=442341 RepID=A0A4R8FFR3_9GAMM|nr:gas vesicle protein GvpD [Halomonas xianhensis]TDX24796.1 circadian clock protein KaiC [Halomonas xianhensis]